MNARRDVPPLVLGFLATSFQVFLLREFSAQFYGNELTYGFVLAAWLLWGGIGGMLGSRARFSPARLTGTFAAVIALFPAALLALRFARRILGVLPGELTGMAPPLLFALGLCLIVGLPFGLLFTLNARALDGDVSRVYMLESLGAAAGGLFVSGVLVPALTDWQGAALAALAGAAALVAVSPGRRARAAAALGAGVAALGTLAAMDAPAERAAWRPFHLVETRDSPFGRLSVIREGGQVSLYENNLIAFTSSDPAAAQDAVHFAMLQNPAARRVLVVGGGAGSGVAEALKYRAARVDYVEPDPRILRLAEKYLPEEEKAALRDPRVSIHAEDGRGFLDRPGAVYDAILIDLPEPASAQINRFYTLEFFETARRRLARGGVLSFTVAASEAYIGPDLARFLASLYWTLKLAFPQVKVVPGETNVFLGSEAPLTIDAGELLKRMAAAGVEATYVGPGFLPDRLGPARVRGWRERVEGAPVRINRDFTPVGYYFHSVLWASQFKGAERAALEFFARIPDAWWIDVPLAVFAAALAGVALRRRTSPVRYLVPLAVLGLTSIVTEVVVIVAFQAVHGYLYGAIAGLLAAFMAGLFAGAWAARKRPGGDAVVAALVGALVLMLIGLGAAIHARPAGIVFFAALALLGAIGGALFSAANRLYLRERRDVGQGYGVDMLGSFAGALAASAFVIPLAGIDRLLTALILANSLTLLFVVVTSSRRRSPSSTWW